MSKKKETKASKSATMPSLQRLLYFRYGLLGLDKNFTLAEEIFTTGSIPEDLREQVDERGLDVLVRVGQLVQKLQISADEVLDANRLRLTRAYFEFLRLFDRPPTQKELLRREWELRAFASRAAKRLPADEGLLREKLDDYFSGKASLPSGMPAPMDRRNGSSLIAELGFSLLDGQALLTYRAIFNRETSKGKPPSLARFLRATMGDSRVKRRRSDLLTLLDLPLARLIDVIASPYEIHPFMRWVHTHEAQSTILHQYLVNRADLDEAVKGDVKEVHELLFQLGLKLDLLHQGTDDLHYRKSLQRLAAEASGESDYECFSNFLAIPAGESQGLHHEFYSTAESLGVLPDFDSFWLSRPIARGIVAMSPDISASRIALLEAFAESYQKVTKAVSAPMVKDIAAGFVPIGILAECFEKSHRIREPLIFWDSLTKGWETR